jgi:hypothetical protein
LTVSIIIILQVKEKNSKPHIEVSTSQGEKLFAPEEISAMVLGKMKETAEAYLGKKVMLESILQDIPYPVVGESISQRVSGFA